MVVLDLPFRIDSLLTTPPAPPAAPGVFIADFVALHGVWCFIDLALFAQTEILEKATFNNINRIVIDWHIQKIHIDILIYGTEFIFLRLELMLNFFFISFHSRVCRFCYLYFEEDSHIVTRTQDSIKHYILICWWYLQILGYTEAVNWRQHSQNEGTMKVFYYLFHVVGRTIWSRRLVAWWSTANF